MPLDRTDKYRRGVEANGRQQVKATVSGKTKKNRTDFSVCVRERESIITGFAATCMMAHRGQ